MYGGAVSEIAGLSLQLPLTLLMTSLKDPEDDVVGLEPSSIGTPVRSELPKNFLVPLFCAMQAGKG